MLSATRVVALGLRGDEIMTPTFVRMTHKNGAVVAVNMDMVQGMTPLKDGGAGLWWDDGIEYEVKETIDEILQRMRYEPNKWGVGDE